MLDIIKAVILGFIEGLTEYLPVSSTGHLLLVEHFFGFGDKAFGNTFAIVIQFGAILALLAIYFWRLVQLATHFFTNAVARRFVFGILLSFMPAAVVGYFLHGFIKSVLFNPWIVCVSLVVGGLVLVWVESLDLKPRHREVAAFSMPMYFLIGVFQCFAMIPGVSRSGATIVSAMLLGADRRAAAEFSFWLAMPTMAGAFALELFQEPARAQHQRCAAHRRRLRGLVHLRLDRGEDLPRLRVAPWFHGVCLVAADRRHARHRRPDAGTRCRLRHSTPTRFTTRLPNR
jgi:undecaprenyl-diphosphatase